MKKSDLENNNIRRLEQMASKTTGSSEGTNGENAIKNQELGAGVGADRK